MRTCELSLTSYIGKDTLDSDKYYDAENAEFDYDQFHKDFPDMSKAGEVGGKALHP